MYNFVHLRCRTNYSISEGSMSIYDIIDSCNKLNYPAVAITDTRNLFGAREFSSKLSSNGMQPIIGMQLEVYYTTTSNHKVGGIVVLLVKNIDGYTNLLKLHDISYNNKVKHNLINPAVSLDELLSYSENLICLSGGTSGFLSKIILNSQDIAFIINQFKDKFKDSFYIELNRHYSKEDAEIEVQFLSIAQDYNIPIVATNDVFFQNQADYEANDILLCIGQGVPQKETDRNHANQEAYFKSATQMNELFKDLPEALENTIKIAKQCLFFVEKQELSLPSFATNEDELIIKESEEGLTQRLINEVYPRMEADNSKEEIDLLYKDRLKFELDVIIKMGFCGYFLIVSDFIKWSKTHNIPVGPGRGSGAGSLVAWCLFITDVDPIQFSLLFERFLNPERISMPDFDIDFCQDGRDKVIEYVSEKYHKTNVAHIITFGTLQAKAAIKDVGRAMSLPYLEINTLSKKIPFSAPSNPITISRLLSEEGDVKEEIKNKPEIKKLFDLAKKVEGLYRNISTHAAGVVISKKPLNEVVPLYYDETTHFPSVGFSMKYIEDVGLVKFDFLSLGTLTIIKMATETLKNTENISLNILQIPYKDQKISELLSQGNTLGVFQLESRGMTEVIKQLKPDTIEDIIAIISLYRPGPMENIPTYINRKHGKEKIEYLHEKMQATLDETFGIMIYQEQVMQIAQIVAGYTLGGADILRRAMGKKDPVEMEKQKSIFIDGAKNYNNIPEELSGKIFEQMEKFAGYGFNKSHATAYALISWQTAYLKAYYPAEFLSASMSADINSNNKELSRFLEFLEEAKKFNIELLPPSVNSPAEKFTIEKDANNNKSIRYCLLALKGVGHNIVQFLMKEIKAKGKFISLENFLSRIEPTLLNKRCLESFIKSGALDDLCDNRKQLIDNMEMLLNYNSSCFQDDNANQIGLFADIDSNTPIPLNMKPSTDYSKIEKMSDELEVIGCFLSGHPLNEYSDTINRLEVIKTYNDIVDQKLPSAYLTAYLMKIKVSKSKNGSIFANLSLYDKSSVFSLVLFGDNYKKFMDKLQEGAIYIIKTNMKIDGEDIKLFVEHIDVLTNDYKIPKNNKKQQEDKNKPVNMEFILQNAPDIHSLKELIIKDSGKDNLIIKIFNGNNFSVFTLENIMITSNIPEHIKNNPNIKFTSS